MAEQLLTIQEAAQGLDLKQKTIRRWVALRKIEFIKTGEKAVRISSAEVQRIIESGRVPRLAACFQLGNGITQAFPEFGELTPDRGCAE